MLGCIQSWGPGLEYGDPETIRIVVERMAATTESGREIEDIVRAGRLATQTRGTNCTELECVRTEFLCLYADLLTDFNPLASLLGDSQEASAIRNLPILPTGRSRMDCAGGYGKLDRTCSECPCGIAKKSAAL